MKGPRIPPPIDVRDANTPPMLQMKETTEAYLGQDVNKVRRKHERTPSATAQDKVGTASLFTGIILYSPPPGGCLLTSQHNPTHDSPLSQGTPSHYSSSTRGPHHSSSSAKEKHPPLPTSANLEELDIKRARAIGTASGRSVEQGVVEALFIVSQRSLLNPSSHQEVSSLIKKSHQEVS